MGKNRRSIPILVIHAKEDPTVDIRAAHNIRDSWSRCFDINISRDVKIRSGRTPGVSWEHKKYHDGNRRSRIETFFLDGDGHGWYGGNSGEFSYPEAPNISHLIWKFFRNHKL